MIREVLKGSLLLASTGIVVPYAISLLVNVLYGWPRKKSRAFSPRKVYNLNYTFLQKMYLYLRYAPLYFQWKSFYRHADPFRVRKNLAFGRNEQTLDLYLPMTVDVDTPRPVLVFVFGGAWGAGDKNMYGLLCSELANRLNVIVCCPNYAYYPQGYVDDMIQDVVDCISWTYNSVEIYGGDKDKILLMGHSAGAHLCMMAVLELLHDELVQTGQNQSRLILQESIQFKESHYDGASDDIKKSRKDLDDSSGSSGSFCVLNGNGDSSKLPSLDASTTTSTFELLSDKSDKQGQETKSEDMEEELNKGIENEDDVVLKTTAECSDIVLTKPLKDEDEIEEDEDEIEEDEESDEASVVSVKPRELKRCPTLVDLGKSIRAVIGLAGVYHIGDHYVHEESRGVEDVSTMAKAMYEEEHFERFSPTSLIQTLSSSASLPPIVLLHGTEDYVVPLSSTTKFGEAVKDIYGNVTIRILPGCDHYELCLDLMKSNRKFYEPVMGIVMETASKVLK